MPGFAVAIDSTSVKCDLACGHGDTRARFHHHPIVEPLHERPFEMRAVLHSNLDEGPGLERRRQCLPRRRFGRSILRAQGSRSPAINVTHTTIRVAMISLLMISG